jgi:hypothetical protein
MRVTAANALEWISRGEEMEGKMRGFWCPACDSSRDNCKLCGGFGVVVVRHGRIRRVKKRSDQKKVVCK